MKCSTLAVLSLVLSLVLVPFASAYDCKNYAGKVAENSLKEKGQREDDKPSVSEIHVLDASYEESDKDIGIYGVDVGVMEECIEGVVVETKIVRKDGRPSCKVVKISSWYDRDCG